MTRTVRQQTPVLQVALTQEIHRARTETRIASRAGLEAELGEPLGHAGLFDDEATDAAASFAAAAALAAAWSSAALLAIAAYAATENGLPRALAKLPASVDGNARRTAATETARAFNDERDEILILLGGGDSGTPAHHAREQLLPGLFKVWSAVLDGVTCERCWRVDGTTIEAHKAFPSGPPPMHPHCRCIIEHVIVNKPERLEDIEIDYELFKRELADVVLEKRKESSREALAFVSESLGSKRSPVVLSKRFRTEPYATRR